SGDGIGAAGCGIAIGGTGVGGARGGGAGKGWWPPAQRHTPRQALRGHGLSPPDTRTGGHSACNAAARTSVTSGGLLRPPSSLSLQPMRVNADPGPRPGKPALSDDLRLPQFAGVGGSGGIAAEVFGARSFVASRLVASLCLSL